MNLMTILLIIVVCLVLRKLFRILLNSKMNKIIDGRWENYAPPHGRGFTVKNETLRDVRYRRLVFVTLVRYGFSVQWILLARNIKKAGGFFKYCIIENDESHNE